ncbi:MAG: hypothetical protein WD894_00715 [Pirellulales bacterium]
MTTQKKAKSKKPTKPYWEMNKEELAAATAEFDREFVIDEFKPLTPAQRAKWKRLQRKPGRPKVGNGVKVISLSVEQGLLARADRLAKKLKISRAQLVRRGLEAVLAGKC